MSAQEGGEAEGVREKEAAVAVGAWRGGAPRPGWCGAEGNPAKLKLCLTSGGRCEREAELGSCEMLEDEEVDEVLEEEEEEEENEEE